MKEGWKILCDPLHEKLKLKPGCIYAKDTEPRKPLVGFRERMENV